jgi:hypothetical protein
MHFIDVFFCVLFKCMQIYPNAPIHQWITQFLVFVTDCFCYMELSNEILLFDKPTLYFNIFWSVKVFLNENALIFSYSIPEFIYEMLNDQLIHI